MIWWMKFVDGGRAGSLAAIIISLANGRREPAGVCLSGTAHQPANAGRSPVFYLRRESTPKKCSPELHAIRLAAHVERGRRAVGADEHFAAHVATLEADARKVRAIPVT